MATDNDSTLKELLKKAIAAERQMTPEERASVRKEQYRSFVKGQLALSGIPFDEVAFEETYNLISDVPFVPFEAPANVSNVSRRLFWVVRTAQMSHLVWGFSEPEADPNVFILCRRTRVSDPTATVYRTTSLREIDCGHCRSILIRMKKDLVR